MSKPNMAGPKKGLKGKQPKRRLKKKPKKAPLPTIPESRKYVNRTGMGKKLGTNWKFIVGSVYNPEADVPFDEHIVRYLYILDRRSYGGCFVRGPGTRLLRAGQGNHSGWIPSAKDAEIHYNQPRLISSLEELIKDDEATSRLKDHIDRTVQRKIHHVNVLRERKKDIGLLLASIAINKLIPSGTMTLKADADGKKPKPFSKLTDQNVSITEYTVGPTDIRLLEDILATRESKKLKKATSNAQETYFYYVQSEGDPRRFREIYELHRRTRITHAELAPLRSNELILHEGYTSFADIIDAILKLKPKGKSSVREICSVIRNIPYRIRRHAEHEARKKRSTYLKAAKSKDFIPTDVASGFYTAPDSTYVLTLAAEITSCLGGDLSVLSAAADTALHIHDDMRKCRPDYDIPTALGHLNDVLRPLSTEDRKRLLKLAMETNLQERYYATENNQPIPFTFKVSDMSEQALTHEGLLAKLEATYRRAIHVNSDVRDDDRVSLWKAYEDLTATHESLTASELEENEEIMDIIVERMRPRQATKLLPQCLTGKLITSKSSMDWLLDHYQKTRLIDLFGDEGSERLKDVIASEIDILNRYGAATAKELHRSIEPIAVTRENGGAYSFRPALQHKTYKVLLQEIVPAVAKIPEECSQIITDKHLSRFIKYARKHKFSPVALKEIILTFIDKSRQIIFNTKNSTSDNAKEAYSKWTDLICSSTPAEMLDRLRYGNLDEIFEGKERDSNVQYSEVSAELVKFAGLLGEKNHVSHRGRGIEGRIILPIPRRHSIELPENVNCFRRSEDNRSIHKLLASLQAGMSLYGYSDEDRAEPYRKLPNPIAAREILDSLNYIRSRRRLARQFPGLAKEIDETTAQIGELYSKSVINEAPDYTGVTQALADVFVLGVNTGTKPARFARSLTPLFEGIEDLPEDEFERLVKRIYDEIDDYTSIPRLDDEKHPEAMAVKSTRARADGHGSAKYVGNEIHFYHECEDVRVARVIVNPASAVTNDRVAKLKSADRGRLESMKRLLEAIKPQRVRIERRVYEGEIDEAALHDFLLEKKTGQSPDTNIMRNRRITERDIAILLTANQAKILKKKVDGERALEHVRAALVYMSDAARIVDDPFAIYGYTSRGPNDVFVNVFKGFHEPPSAETEYRLGLMGATARSRTGVAYRYFADLMSQVPAARKIHIDIVAKLSDDTNYEGDTGIKDTAKGAMIERARGVELFALCMDPEADTAALDEIYGPGHYRIISHVDRLPQATFDIYRTLTMR